VVGFEFQFDVSTKLQVLSPLQGHRGDSQQETGLHLAIRGHPGDSVVTFDLFAEGGKTRLRLTHEGLETFPKLPRRQANFAAGLAEIVGTS